jgi:predicted dehydrogenase
MNILRSALAHGRSRVVGLADADANQLQPALAEVERLTGSRPAGFRDYRELLAQTRPEVVIVATPDHWHALNTIAAIESGAHVYVEKPISHTIDEGKAMVSAARRHGRVVQVGTHRRVSPHNISAMQFLKAGRVGKIGVIRAFVYYGRDSAGSPPPPQEPPRGLDWDLWCGPAPLRPYSSRIHPRGFRQYLDFANGVLGDWGIHWMDQILWWTEERFPRTVYSTGGLYYVRDGSDAPDAQVATYQFEDFTVVWEHRTYTGHPEQKHQVGCYFFGSEGVLHLGWLDGWTFYPRRKGEPELHEEPKLHEPDQQNIPELWADFMDAIDHRRRPVCDIEIGHRSTNVSLLGMISLKLGRSLRWDGEREVVVDDPEANRLLRRTYRSPWQYPEA